jgi:hypothetical protein
MTDKERLLYYKMMFANQAVLSMEDMKDIQEAGNWLIKKVEILQKLKENIIDTMRFAEKEMSMYDNDYVRGIYHAYKDILTEIERLEEKK